MANELSNLLEELQAKVQSSEASRSVIAANVVRDIFNYALDVPESERSYISSLLFSEDKGVLKFVKVASGLREFEGVKADILRFLTEYCRDDIDKNITCYTKVIKDCCLSSFSCDQSVKVKIESLNVLLKLLTWDVEKIEEDLDAPAIVNRIWSQCLQSARLGATLRCIMYSLIGVLSEKFPNLIKVKSDRLLKLYLGFLKQEMETKKGKPEFLVISGCLKGLTSYLVNFTQSVSEGSKYAVEIFKYIKRCILFKDFTRYDALKAALTLLQKHCAQFKELITDQAEVIYDALETWSNHANRDVKYLAIATTDAVLLQISVCLSENTNLKKSQYQSVLKSFMKKFRFTLSSSNSTAKEVLAAIKGYGKFAEACNKVFKPSEMKLMFEEILKRSEQCYLNVDSSQEESFYQLPTFLQSLANIIKYLEEISLLYLFPLERLAIVLFDAYPKLGKKGQNSYHNSLSMLISALFSSPAMFKTCLSQIVYQTMIRTCSYPLNIDKIATEDPNEVAEVKTTYKTFLPIWKSLLNEKSYKLSIFDHPERLTAIKEQVYDEIMEAILTILKKLNLKTCNEDQGKEISNEKNDANSKENQDNTMTNVENDDLMAVSDPTKYLQAEVPSDFLIFVNLVEFCKDLLASNSKSLFQKWVPLFVEELIIRSTRNPLVSGFYKLLQVTCQIIEDVGYFQDLDEGKQGLPKDKENVFMLLKGFMKEVKNRAKQYNGELLVSCIELLLCLPICVVRSSSTLFVEPLQTAFKLGLSQYELAELGLKTLEKWNEELDSSSMNDMLKQVLPLLNDYLQSNIKANETNIQEKVSFAKSDLRLKRTSVRYLKALINANKQTMTSPIMALKLRIINFLGKLGGAANIGMLENCAFENLSKALAWDKDEHLSFALPFQDMKPTIYLDSYLPRVVELALNSSNRQTKVVACELLHALVLYMLGTSVQKAAEKNNQSSLETLYKKIFPELLKLACSMEQVAEQLFSPLVFQIIHWLTGNTKYESPETIALLEALLDGVCDSTDSSLRDFSAICVKEFLHWSIKQTQWQKKHNNPKSLFKRLASLALHPNVYKRLGAAVVFNNIYTVFREEESLVDIFALDLLILFVNSLSRAHQDETSSGTVEQCEHALTHLEKIIKKKSEILYKSNKKRKKPQEFRGVDSFNLIHVNIWLLRQCGTPQTACRHQCMKLVHSFIPLQPGCTSLKSWMQTTVKDKNCGHKFFTSKFERGGLASVGIRTYATVKDRAKDFSLSLVNEWLECFLAALETYCWIFGERLLPSADLLGDNPETNIFPAIMSFLQDIAMKTSRDLEEQYKYEDIPTVRQQEKFKSIKCTVLVRLLNFLTVTLNDGLWRTEITFKKDIFNEAMFTIIFRCIFSPQSVGFDVTDFEVLQKLPEELCSFVEIFLRAELTDYQVKLTETISQHLLEKKFDILEYLPLDIVKSRHETDKHTMLAQIVNGYITLHKSELLKKILTSQKCFHICEQIMISLTNSLVPLSGSHKISVAPTQKSLAGHLLKFALLLDEDYQKLVNLLFDKTKTDTRDDYRSEETRGGVFYHLFPGILSDHFVEHPRDISKLMEHGMKHERILCAVLEGVVKACLNHQEKRRNSTKVTETILSNWVLLSNWRASQEMLPQFTELAKAMLLLSEDVLKNNDVVNIFIMSLTNYDLDLSIKENIIEISPKVLAGCNENKVNEMKAALRLVASHHFPICSDDLTKGSTKYMEYMSCLSKFLKALASSSNIALFEVLVSVMVQETKEFYERNLESYLISFIKSGNAKIADQIFQYCIDLFRDKKNYANVFRRNVIERILLVTLNHTTAFNVRAFFAKNIKFLMEVVELRLNKANEDEFEIQLIDKICSYKMLSLLFQLVNKSYFTTTTSEILKAFCVNPSTGKELTSALSKSASAAYKEDVRGETLHGELRRQYHCAAYNCLISIISCTQTVLKFYTGLLFAENPAKGSFVFENLVDSSRNYVFESELSMPFSKKKSLKLIRDSVTEQADGKSKIKGGYISTQYLLGSSLSQDVSQFDFNSPADAYKSYAVMTTDDDGIYSEGSQDPSSPQPMETVIEMDDLNQHECMAVLLALINHMRSNNIYSIPKETSSTTELPTWMTYLQKKMTNKETNINIKLFITKLIINEPKVFEPFGHFWFSPLVELILSGKIQGSPLNYFVSDIILVMLSWSSTVVPEDTVSGRNLCSSLLDYLFKNCHHSNRSVLKNNLQIIQTLLKVWKDRLEISYKIIYDLFQCSESDKKDNSTGIQLLGFVLSNGFKPYNRCIGVTEDQYFTALTRNLSFKYKEVFAAAAEVCSLALKYYDDSQLDNTYLFNMVHEYLSEFSKGMKDKFVMCLHSMHLHYPKTVDSYISQLLYCLMSLYGILKTQCLQCLASRVSELKPKHRDIFNQLKGKELVNLLSHREEETQLAAIKLIKGLAPSLTPDEVASLIPSIAVLLSNGSVAIREAIYDLFMWIFDEYRKESAMETENNIDILRLSKEVLLTGINDRNTELSLKIMNFWRDESRLPNSTIERLIEILRALYSTKTEKDYLSYSTNLLLQLTSLSPDYTRPLFDSGLDSEENFHKFHVNFSWQRQNIAMTPLFVDTQSTMEPSYAQTQGARYLRATQRSFDFTQTNQESASNDWMNPSAQITAESFTSSPSSLSSSTKGSYLNTTFSTSQSKSINRGVTTPSHKDSILYLKNRVMKDPKLRNVYFANMEIKKQKMRKMTLDRQRAARDRKVVMYRKYRAGELPDIQIKHSELIVPLQALSQLDSQIAQKLFGTIFSAVISNLPNKLSDEPMEKALAEIQEALEVMMKSTISYNPSFISAIQNICYKNKEFKLDAQVIASNSVISMQQPIGILLLEKQLLTSTSINLGPRNKRPRSLNNKADDIGTWLELAKVYESISDYDFLRSIFSCYVSKVDFTKDALAAETRNDFETALSLYRQASAKEDWEEDSPTEEEEEYWDNARLRCYENLSMWKNLNEFTVKSMTQVIDDGQPFDVMNIWQDDLLQEVYLPCYVKSNMKLLCQGKHDDVHKDFSRFINESLRQEETKELLEARYCDELALLNILQDNFGAAEHYINMSKKTFLEEWAQLSQLVYTNQVSKLQRLQKMTELGELVKLMNNVENDKESQSTELISNWSTRPLDEKLHSVLVWDDIVWNRCAMMRKMKSKFQASKSFAEFTELKEATNLLEIADVARKQGNFAVANQYLRDSYGVFKKNYGEDSSSIMLQWRHVYVQVHCDRVKIHQRDTKTNMLGLKSAYESLGKCKEKSSEDATLSIKQNLLEHEVWDCVAGILKKNANTNEISFVIKTVLSFPNMKNGDMEKCIEQAHQHSRNALSVALSTVENIESKEERSLLQIQSLMKMVAYCNDRLKENDDQVTDQHAGYADSIIRNLLKAMKMNSIEARLRFPRLLQLIDIFPETRDLFANQCADVPCWMFLGWVNQIIALIDKPLQKAVMPILKQIARSYPQAIMFPLKVSSVQYQFGNTPDGKRRKVYFDKLLEHVSIPWIDSFTDALGQLTHPAHIFKDYLEKLAKLIRNKDTEKVQACYRELSSRLLNTSSRTVREESQKTFQNVLPGAKAREFKEKYGKPIEEAFGKDGKNLIGMNDKQFNAVRSKLSSQLNIVVLRGNLKDFSPWLNDFQASNYEDRLEIPGQYSGESKPMLEYHVKVASFDERLLTLESIRQPKRITIRGDDEKEYRFLVKGGEDLRLDQRVEQIFEQMNVILKKDPQCSNRLLQLNTYKVIPLTSRVGIIQWVDDTAPYMEVLKGTMTKREEGQFNEPSKLYKKQITNKGANGRDYKQWYKKVSRTEAMRLHNERVAMIPWDLLRRAFNRFASSSEAYFVLRNHFIQAYSCMCIAQYILGIGDRHLLNTLIDKRTGGVVGIDFGHAFGTATQLLGIPELMPFRLTAQMTNLLLPLQDPAPYKQSMIAVMQAFRKNASILLNTMDVFINEPLLDWESHAKKQAKALGESAEEGVTLSCWYPKHKIKICKQKLLGINSAFIMSEELKAAKKDDKAFREYVDVVNGVPENIRRKLLNTSKDPGSYYLTVEEQIDCLVDQATDANILGRTYHGWQPWV